MLEQLFGSKTRVKLLKVFFMKPEEAFFVRELSRSVGVQINAIRRELELLGDVGLIKEVDKKLEEDDVQSGSALRKYYGLNQDCIIFKELHALLLKEKVLGEEQFITDLKKKVGDIHLLLLTGSFTGSQEAGTDLLVVGKLKERALALLVAKYEKEFGFDIRYTTMTAKEFLDRRYVMDKFLYSLFAGQHLKVVNTLGI